MSETAAPAGPYTLPPLKFGYADLEPIISEETMRFHHDAHHRGYVDAVNKALEKHPEWLGKTIEDVLRSLQAIPEDIRTQVRNQGGGHANHQFFWKILTPHSNSGRPTGELAKAIDRDFGSYEAFKKQFEEAGLKQFGSGWVFLVVRPKQDFKLEIMTLPNQDSVLIQPEPAPGLLACDVWEHAYYLTYRNRRAEWLSKWWEVVNWDYVGERLQGVHEGRKQL